MSPSLIICMGVSGVGKSTCAEILAAEFNLIFIEADELHSLSNKQKMQSGEALTDLDRVPWMQAVCEQLKNNAKRGLACVLAHSALRRSHRVQLRNCGLRTLFLYLSAPSSTIALRLNEREGHYMKADLLCSQFKALQSTHNERDVLTLNAAQDRDVLMAQLSKHVNNFIAEK